MYTKFQVIAVRSVTYRTDRKKVWHKIERTYKTEVEAINSKPFTRNQRASSLSEQNKSALTDHISQDNHVIYWPAATILDRESDKSTRWIKEAVHVRKEGRRCLNRDGELHSEPGVRRITKQLNLTAIIQSRRLSIFGHIACVDDGEMARWS